MQNSNTENSRDREASQIYWTRYGIPTWIRSYRRKLRCAEGKAQSSFIQPVKCWLPKKSPFESSSKTDGTAKQILSKKFLDKSVILVHGKFEERKLIQNSVNRTNNDLSERDLDQPTLCRRKSSEILQEMQVSEFEQDCENDNQENISDALNVQNVQTVNWMQLKANPFLQDSLRVNSSEPEEEKVSLNCKAILCLTEVA